MRLFPALTAAILTVTTPASAQRSEAFDGVTTALLIGVPIGLLAWDGYLAVKHARTESMLMRDAAWQISAVPYGIGFVAGHWFLNFSESRERYVAVGLIGLAAVAAVDIAVRSDGRPAWRYPGIWFGVGVLSGAFTWGQRF